MKLRLPSKLVAAILAAASPVLLQTLSSATLGAAAVAAVAGVSYGANGEGADADNDWDSDLRVYTMNGDTADADIDSRVKTGSPAASYVLGKGVEFSSTGDKMAQHTITMGEGSTILITASSDTENHRQIEGLTLTGDATINTQTYNVGVIAGGHGPASVALDGNTLTLTGSPETRFRFSSTTFSGGGQVVAENGMKVNLNKKAVIEDGTSLVFKSGSSLSFSNSAAQNMSGGGTLDFSKQTNEESRSQFWALLGSNLTGNIHVLLKGNDNKDTTTNGIALDTGANNRTAKTNYHFDGSLALNGGRYTLNTTNKTWLYLGERSGETVHEGSLTVTDDLRLQSGMAVGVREGGALTVGGTLILGHASAGYLAHLDISGGAATLGALCISAFSTNDTITMSSGSLEFTSQGNAVLYPTGTGTCTSTVTFTGGTLKATQSSWTLNHALSVGGVTIETTGDNHIALGDATHTATLTSGTITNNGHLDFASVAVAQDAAVTIGGSGTTTFTETVTNNGSLALGGTINLEMAPSSAGSALDGYGYINADGTYVNGEANGYVLKSDMAFTIAAGGTLSAADNTTWLVNGGSVNNAALNGNTLSVGVGRADSVYHVNTGTVVYDGGTMFSGMTGMEVATDATLQIATGASLHSSMLSNSGSVELTGGTLVLDNGNAELFRTVTGTSGVMDLSSKVKLTTGQGSAFGGTLIIRDADKAAFTEGNNNENGYDLVLTGNGANAASFNKVILDHGAAIRYNGATDSSLNNLTLEEGSEGRIYIEHTPANTGTFSLLGTTELQSGATLNLLSHWSSNVAIAQLSGSGALHIHGSSTNTDENANHYVVSSLQGFSGDLTVDTTGHTLMTAQIKTGSGEDVTLRSLTVGANTKSNTVTLSGAQQLTIGTISVSGSNAVLNIGAADAAAHVTVAQTLSGAANIAAGSTLELGEAFLVNSGDTTTLNAAGDAVIATNAIIRNSGTLNISGGTLQLEREADVLGAFTKPELGTNGFVSQNMVWHVVEGEAGATTTISDTTIFKHGDAVLESTITGASVDAAATLTTKRYFVGTNSAYSDISSDSAGATAYEVGSGVTLKGTGANLASKDLILDSGSTLQATGTEYFDTAQMKSLTLADGNATICTDGYRIALVNTDGNNYQNVTLDLNGHTLYVTGRVSSGGNNNNSYFGLVGNTTVTAGTIDLADSVKLQQAHSSISGYTVDASGTLLKMGNASQLRIAGGNTMQLKAIQTKESDDASQIVKDGSNTGGTIALSPDADYTFRGTLSNSLDYTINGTAEGSQTFSLTAASAVGALTVNSGTLAFAHAGSGESTALTTGRVTLAAAGTLSIGNGVVATISGGSVAAGATLINNGTMVLNATSGNVDLLKAATGTGNAVITGSMTVGQGVTLGLTGNLTVRNGANLTLANGNNAKNNPTKLGWTEDSTDKGFSSVTLAGGIITSDAELGIVRNLTTQADTTGNKISFNDYSNDYATHPTTFSGNTTLNSNLEIYTEFKSQMQFAHLTGSGDLSFTVGNRNDHDANITLNSVAGYTGTLKLLGSLSNSNKVNVKLDTQANNTFSGMELQNATLNLVSRNDANKRVHNLGAVKVLADSTIESLNGYFHSQVEIGSLSGSADLHLVHSSQVDRASVFNINGGNEGAYSGTLHVKQNVSNADGKRYVAMNIKDADVLSSAVISMEATENNKSVTGLGIATDTTVKGITTADTNGEKIIFSGAAAVGATSFDSGRDVHTLTINTAGGEYDANATVKGNLNLTKNGAGTQTFSGNMSAFNKTLTVNSGTLALTGTLGFTAASATVKTGAHLQLTGSGNTTLNSFSMVNGGKLTYGGGDKLTLNAGSSVHNDGSLVIENGAVLAGQTASSAPQSNVLDGVVVSFADLTAEEARYRVFAFNQGGTYDKDEGELTGGTMLEGTIAGLSGHRGTVMADTLTINVAEGQSYEFLHRYDELGNTDDSAVLKVNQISKQGNGTQVIGGEYNEEHGLVIKDGVEVYGGKLHMKTRGTVTTDFSVAGTGTLLTTDNSNSYTSANNAVKYDGKVTLHVGGTLDYADGSTNITKGLYVEMYGQVVNEKDSNQFIAGLYNEMLQSGNQLYFTRTGTDNNRAAINVLTAAGDFAGTVYLKSNVELNEKYGLQVLGESAKGALAGAVVDFSDVGGRTVLSFRNSDTASETWTDSKMDGSVAGLKGTNGAVYANNLTINTANGADYTYGGALNVANIVKDGTGTQNISGNVNSFNGNIDVNDGTLSFTGLSSDATNNLHVSTATVNDNGSLKAGRATLTAKDALSRTATHTGTVSNAVFAANSLKGEGAQGGTLEGGLLEIADNVTYSISEMTLTNSVVDATAEGAVLNMQNVSIDADSSVVANSGALTGENRLTLSDTGEVHPKKNLQSAQLSGLTLQSDASLAITLSNTIGADLTNGAGFTITLSGFQWEDLLNPTSEPAFTLESLNNTFTVTAMVNKKQVNFEVINAQMIAATGSAPVALQLTVVPEPTTGVLSLLALAGMAARRRRK